MQTPSAETIESIATNWAAVDGGARRRILAAVEIVKEGDVTTASDPGCFLVVGKAIYYVDTRGASPTCTCPDHQHRRSRCKHIWAAALLTAATRRESTPRPARPITPRSSTPLPRPPRVPSDIEQLQALEATPV